MNTKALSLIVGAAMAAAGVAGTTSTASASPTIQISFGGLCFHVGPKAPKHVVRIKASWKGFSNVRNTHVIPKRFGSHCGVYRSVGRKFGRKFILISSLKNGRLLRARPIGFGPGYGYRVPGYVIRNKAAMMGYKNLHMLKYHNFSKRYTIRGWKQIGFGWKKYVLRFSRTGFYLGRSQIGGGAVNGAVIKFKAKAMGYKAVHALKYYPISQRYTVEGWRKVFGVWKQYRLRFTKTGQYLGRYAI